MKSMAVRDIGEGELAEFLILEGVDKALHGVGLAGLCIHEILLVELENGDEHTDQSDDGQGDEPDAIGPGVGHEALQRAGQGERQIGQEGAEEEGERNGGGDEHPVFLGFAELGNEGVIGRAVHGHEKIEENEGHEDPDDIDGALFLHGGEENQDSHDRKGNGGPLHKGNTAALRVFAAIGKGGDPRVGDRVEDAADEGDEPQNREHTEDDQAGGHIKLCAGGERTFGREIKGDQPCGHNTGEDGPAELADGKDPHFFFGQTSCFHEWFPPS